MPSANRSVRGPASTPGKLSRSHIIRSSRGSFFGEADFSSRGPGKAEIGQHGARGPVPGFHSMTLDELEVAESRPVRVGLFRTMFVTVGAHIGQVGALAGGYKVGDAVPSSVTAAPVTGSYKVGFGLAFSFTKP